MSCFITLKRKGLRLTQPRKAILDFIHERGDHLNAEQIIEHVQEKLPRVNKSTIYRTLELLEKNECVYRSKYHNRTVYHHADEGHHHHLVCSRCGKTIDCGEDIFAPVERSLGKEYGFDPDFKHMMIRGLCKSCVKESE